MIKYVIKRLLWMIPLILSVTVVIFTLMYFVPGDPARIVAGTDADEEDVELIREKLGLDQPYIVRLKDYVEDVFFHFDFGTSITNGSSIQSSLMERFPRTLLLTVNSLVLTILIGIPLGIIAAVNPNTWKDRIAMFFSLVAVSIPPFWLALMLVIVFALNLGWLPMMGIGSFKYYILPTIANSVIGIAMQARQTRSSMLESLNSDYIVTCRAKGLSRKGIIFRHALPNASIPIITEMFFTLSGGIAGSLIIENVFSIPGIGVYLVNALNSRDYPVVQGTVIFIAIWVCLLNLITDLGYAFVDPRIRASFTGSSKKWSRNKKEVAV
ncbi:ABC transporter permease [Diplocloster agilis]|uniref:ABC transporter permease n=1 Tax=Diplocloster agilis TaxID=2850323 RepID=UPI00082112C1|nr:ABC transporter permease [Suonthocola fibrivorans]MCU6732498.1 ABC transporter permease [Suonthocola fibrivorans]SCI48918.1 Glutathione transport system permease protein gsiC [uncultured Clostridium sp.]